MSKIESLDRDSTQSLISQLNVDLVELGKKYGVQLRINGGKLITDTAATLKLEVTIAGTGSVRAQRLEEHVEVFVKNYFPGHDIEKKIPHPRLGHIKIVGWNTKAHKTPVIAEADDGKRYRFQVSDIKNLLPK